MIRFFRAKPHGSSMCGIVVVVVGDGFSSYSGAG